MMRLQRFNPGIEEALARTFASQRSELLWLAFLLTGDREMSVEAVVDATDLSHAGNPFFRNWMISWSRKLVIAKALSAVEPQMAASVRHTRERRCARRAETPDRSWSLDRDTDKIQLEHALLAIDLFPRCALLLTVFEKVSIDDAAALLNADRESIMTAKAIGLAELTWNLASPEWRETSVQGLRGAASYVSI
jgi:DNA-directed RNA polymerase specialized sigma24 family protein